MTACTFKLFKPNGECRRVKFTTDTPELAEINSVIDGMVQASTEQRSLTYIDSEGDRVVVKSSRDVREAVRDANESSARFIKLYIRDASQRPGNSGRESQKNQRLRGGCRGGQRRPAGPCERGGGLLFHPFWGPIWSWGARGVIDDVTEMVGLLFPGFFNTHKQKQSYGRDNSTSNKVEAEEASEKPPESLEGDEEGSPPKKHGGDDGALLETHNHDYGKEPEEATDDEQGSPQQKHHGAPLRAHKTNHDYCVRQDGQHNPASEDVPVAEPEEVIFRQPAVEASSNQGNQNDDWLKVTVDDQNVPQNSPTMTVTPSGISADEIDAKASLLREMGFELPLDVARKMIAELGGRTDLVVRALVANQK